MLCGSATSFSPGDWVAFKVGNGINQYPCRRPWCLRLSDQSTGSRAALALLHLAEFQLHRRDAAKNPHRDLEPGAHFIDLLNNAIEGREGTIRDTDLLTYLEGNRRLRPLEVGKGVGGDEEAERAAVHRQRSSPRITND